MNLLIRYKFTNIYVNFLIFNTVFIFISCFSNYFINTDELLLNHLYSKLTINQINEFLSFKKKTDLISYFILPLIYLIKTILVTIVLYIGTFFYSKVKVTFKQLWDVVIKAEFLFLLVGVFKIVWFYFFETTYTLEDLQYFYPLSALNIIGYKGLEPWFIYPLQTLNVFEVVYWFILAYYISKMASPTKNVSEYKPNLDFGLKIVMASYGSALLLWVVVVMFFTLNYS